jgi:hypothetical protein
MDASEGDRAAGGIASEPHRPAPSLDVGGLSVVPPLALSGLPSGPAPEPAQMPCPQASGVPVRPRRSTAEEYGPFPVDLPELKDFRTNWVLSLFLGVLGVDRFHRGRPLTGALKLLTLGGAGFWWAGDLLAVAAGYAVDGGGHPMTGRRSHRVLAVAVSLAVILGTGVAAVSAAAPYTGKLAAGAGRTTLSVLTALFPPAEPAWEWQEVATLSARTGTGSSEKFLVSGDALTISYTLDGAGFIYLLPAGTKGVPNFTEPIISTMKAAAGKVTVRAVPGEYRLYAQSAGGWEAHITERVVRKPG